ncbi:hypothetical protein PQZ72_01300 [Candidatus Pelagibacter sp.]|nr:hypothetical protein [Candidatus Pelagibacter sp.]
MTEVKVKYKKLMNELTVKFDKKISLKEFDKQIPKLVENFPSKISLLIKVRIKMDCIFATLKENPNKNATDRWEWDLQETQ